MEEILEPSLSLWVDRGLQYNPPKAFSTAHYVVLVVVSATQIVVTDYLATSRLRYWVLVPWMIGLGFESVRRIVATDYLARMRLLSILVPWMTGPESDLESVTQILATDYPARMRLRY